MAWCRQCNQWNSDDTLPCSQCGTVKPIDPVRLQTRNTSTLWYKIGALLGLAAGATLGAMIDKEAPELAILGAFILLFPGLLLGAALDALSKTRQALAILGLLAVVMLISTLLR